MKRKERIYQYVLKETHGYTERELELREGVTTKDISENLDIQRSNVSKDLNMLVREGKLYKLDGRPDFSMSILPFSPATFLRIIL